MIFGTSKVWWILSAVLFLLGLGLMATSRTTLQTVLGIFSLFAAVGTFAAAPMRYGENARMTRKEREAARKAKIAAATSGQSSAGAPVSELPPAPPLPPRERPTIAGRDASEV